MASVFSYVVQVQSIDAHATARNLASFLTSFGYGKAHTVGQTVYVAEYSATCATLHSMCTAFVLGCMAQSAESMGHSFCNAR